MLERSRVSSIPLGDFSDLKLLKGGPATTSELKASSSVAHAETASGLHKKRKSDTDREPEVAVKKAKGKGKAKVCLK